MSCGSYTCAYVEYLTSYVGISISHLSRADGRSRRVHITCVKGMRGSRRLAPVHVVLHMSNVCWDVPCGICIVSWALAPEFMCMMSRNPES